MASFDDRTVTLDAPKQLADLGAVLGSRTRLAVLAALVRSDKPQNINELARKVGVDASPVRTHLELLMKEDLAQEVDSPSGRERLFETNLTGIRITLIDIHKPKTLPQALPKAALRIQKKIDAITRDIARLEDKARRYADELKKTLAHEQAKPQKAKT